jgi:hypothetical protein
LDENFVAEPIGNAAPQWPTERRDRRRDTHRQPRPQGDVPIVGHTKLTDIEREERHHQGEADEADECGRRDGDLIIRPGAQEKFPP